MANQTNVSKNVSQSGMTSNQKQNHDQKKAFEQGNGNNSTTADPKNDWDEKDNSQQQGLNSQSQSKITNQDPKNTNKDEAIKKDPKAQGTVNDDEDVDENSDIDDYNEEEPEVDIPLRGNEKTEKKIPQMKR